MNQYARRRARKLALQAIYRWQFTDELLLNIENELLADVNSKKVDVEYFTDLVRGVVKNKQTIDEAMQPVLDRKLKELNPVELAVLRLAIYELLFHPEIPFKVIINEALELTKIYGSVEGHKYVNGVLDKLSSTLRAHEKK